MGEVEMVVAEIELASQKTQEQTVGEPQFVLRMDGLVSLGQLGKNLELLYANQGIDAVTQVLTYILQGINARGVVGRVENLLAEM